MKEDGWCRFPIELEKSNELSLKDDFVSSHAKNLLLLLLESKSQLSIDKLWIPSKNEVIMNSKYNAYCLDKSSTEPSG
ncbi:MAG: hypothetical protein M1486_04705 [Gammaproteobacteria bacterium]|nr:hypothetical protein [Gammaproteobacteria bacterium]